MNPADDDWVKAAMTDDTMVVELLARLHHASSTPIRHLKPAAFPIEWTVRQRRSKPVSVTNTSKKQTPTASPTTPLSWSGATSYSSGCGGGGGLEESSRPSKPSTSARSKANGDGEKSSFKRSQKKKTLVELKEEENLLVKERRELKRDIASLRLNLEEQRATNESLKRAKIELQLLNDRGTTSVTKEMISVQLQQEKPAFDSISTMVAPILNSDAILQCTALKQKEIAAFNPKFLVPDLNMPFEEDHNLDLERNCCNYLIESTACYNMKVLPVVRIYSFCLVMKESSRNYQTDLQLFRVILFSSMSTFLFGNVSSLDKM